jgi:hypothetical protein
MEVHPVQAEVFDVFVALVFPPVLLKATGRTAHTVYRQAERIIMSPKKNPACTFFPIGTQKKSAFPLMPYASKK